MPYAEHLKQPGQLFAITLQRDDDARIVWAYLSDLQPVRRLSALQHQLQELEAACWRDGVIGWYCVCDAENQQMRRWIEAAGATAFKEADGTVSYAKKILNDPATSWRSIKEAAATIAHHREVGHG